MTKVGMMTSGQFQVKLVDLEQLKEHEEIDPKYLKKLKEEIRMDGVLKKPIVVDKNTNIILDGEHRFKSLEEIGCLKIPIIYLDYNIPEIKVKSWKKGTCLSKQMIIKAGLTQKKLSSRTSKHMMKIGKKLKHISSIQKRINIPLSELQ